jgi:hypothetical protein
MTGLAGRGRRSGDTCRGCGARSSQVNGQLTSQVDRIVRSAVSYCPVRSLNESTHQSFRTIGSTILRSSPAPRYAVQMHSFSLRPHPKFLKYRAGRGIRAAATAAAAVPPGPSGRPAPPFPRPVRAARSALTIMNPSSDYSPPAADGPSRGLGKQPRAAAAAGFEGWGLCPDTGDGVPACALYKSPRDRTAAACGRSNPPCKCLRQVNLAQSQIGFHIGPILCNMAITVRFRSVVPSLCGGPRATTRARSAARRCIAREE